MGIKNGKLWSSNILKNLKKKKKKVNKVGHKKFFGVKVWDGKKKKKGTGIVLRNILTLKTPSGAALLEIWEILKL